MPAEENGPQSLLAAAWPLLTSATRIDIAKKFPQMVSAGLAKAREVALAMSRDVLEVQMDLAGNLASLNNVDGKLAVDTATFLISSSESAVRCAVAGQIGELYQSDPLIAAGLVRRLALDPATALAVADQLPQIAKHDTGLVHEIVATLGKERASLEI